MKKITKIILLIIGIIILLTIIDITFIYTKGRPLFAIKSQNGLVYRGVFYDTYNCHEYSIPQIKRKNLRLACLPLDIETAKESTYHIEKIENVDIRTSNVSRTGATIVITDTNKNPYKHGLWYEIEKEENGKWYKLTTLIDNDITIAYGYLPDENNEVIFEINWEDIYGKLTPGNYRIIKKVIEKYMSVEFGIQEVKKEG